MKKLLFLAVILFFSANLAMAERPFNYLAGMLSPDQQIMVEGDSLRIYQFTKTLIASYPKPPKAVNMDSALAIMQAGQGQYVEDIEKIDYSMNFWPLYIKETTHIKKRIWAYKHGKWLPPTPFGDESDKDKIDWLDSLLSLYLVFLFLLIVSLINRFKSNKKEETINKKAIFFFYGAILTLAFVGWLLASVLGILALDFVIGIIGAIIGAFWGAVQGAKSTNIDIGEAFGLSTGLIIGFYAPLSNIYYIAFLAASCVVSYLLAWLVRVMVDKIKNKFFNRPAKVSPATTPENKA